MLFCVKTHKMNKVYNLYEKHTNLCQNNVFLWCLVSKLFIFEE